MKLVISFLVVIMSFNVFSSELVLSGKMEDLNGKYDFVGSIEELQEKVDTEVFQGKLNISVKGLSENQRFYMENAKEVASNIWKVMFDGATPYPPFPCGSHLVGEYKSKWIKKNTYLISGRGDSYTNTCTNRSGPGSWGYKLIVEFNPLNNKGSVVLEGGEE